MLQPPQYPQIDLQPAPLDDDTERVTAVYIEPEPINPIDVESTHIDIVEEPVLEEPKRKRGRKPKADIVEPEPIVEVEAIMPAISAAPKTSRPKTLQARMDAIDTMKAMRVDGRSLYDALRDKLISVNKSYALVAETVKISKPVFTKLVQEIREAGESL